MGFLHHPEMDLKKIDHRNETNLPDMTHILETTSVKLVFDVKDDNCQCQNGTAADECRTNCSWRVHLESLCHRLNIVDCIGWFHSVSVRK